MRLVLPYVGIGICFCVVLWFASKLVLQVWHFACHSACNIDPVSRGIGVQKSVLRLGTRDDTCSPRASRAG